ncbi:SDR family oxidoreductase [Halobacillus halophilus]|uniref:elongation factor P 5-aminopentanone reductase n=1 Tax=Halobacillus halophilus TaxID=1570 RepID=UPI00136E7CBE|nr:SDR family oxidoreductase [Halobacillus halophilus]MYL28401.1 SDR family oxidoreductase [Halobacillus halophilus]
MNRKRCLILGASGGIGEAVVHRVIEDGYAAAVQYFTNEDKIRTIQQGIPEDQWAGSFQADLSTKEGMQAFFRVLPPEWDAVVFAGGHMYSGLFQHMEEEDMDALYYVHVKSLWMTARHVLPYMIQQKQGNIAVVSSIFGTEGASMEVAYSSVKGAQNTFVKGLAQELAPSHIRVNAVAPGLIQTKMNGHLTLEDLQALENDIPMGRAGTPEEVADAVGFLLSRSSRYVTGQILHVNGGWC